MRRGLVMLAATAAALAAAPAAHADDQSFLDYIHDHGVPSSYPLGSGDESNLLAGDMICRMLRTGHSVSELPFLGFAQEQYKPQLVEGAQHKLCPETLH